MTPERRQKFAEWIHDNSGLNGNNARELWEALQAAEAREKLRDQHWQEIMQEEVAHTMQLFDALGCDQSQVQNEGRPIMEVMLDRIAAIREECAQVAEKRAENLRALARKAYEQGSMERYKYHMWRREEAQRLAVIIRQGGEG